MVSDIKEMEIARGKHYHAWSLMESVEYMHPVGDRPASHARFLRYSAAKMPHLSRVTARRHAKQMAEPEYGKAGYMALVCDGGEACPFFFNPFKGGFNPVTLKFDKGDSNG